MLRHMPAGLLAFGLLFLSIVNGLGQTPPIAPNTVDTPIPPRVTVAGPPAPPDVPNRPLTADEAARIALHHGPTVAIARAAVLAAQGRTQQVRAGLLPAVSTVGTFNHLETLSGSGGGTGGSTSTGTSTATSGEGFNFTAGLKQLIFDFNHTRDLIRQSGALVRAAGHDLTRVEFDLVFTVKQAYYNVVQSGRLVTVNEANVANRQAQLALARARLNSGLGLPSDVATAETSVADAVLNLSVARNNDDQARVNLALLMGIDPRIPVQVGDTDEPTFANDDVNSLVDMALKLRPEILEAQANIAASHYAVNAARTTNLPIVSGNLQVGSRGTVFPPGNDTMIVGAAIQFTPFDGGLTAGLVKSARANESAVQAQLVSIQLTVTADVTQAYFSLRTAEQRVTAANNDVTNATEQVRIATGRYRSGLGLFLDIITAQAALVTARSSLVATQFIVDQARAAITRAIGNPPPSNPPPIR